MKKNLLQDVIPSKKTIRNIGISPKSKSSLPRDVRKETARTGAISPSIVERLKEDDSVERKLRPSKDTSSKATQDRKAGSNKDIPSYEYISPVKRSKRFWYTALGVFLVVFIFGISAIFRSAEIRVTPRHETKSLDDTFSAKKEVVSSWLTFQVVTISKNIDKTVVATDEQKVEKKAQGKIVIYNNYNAISQKLVATTRFETPEGLIFRLVSSVAVPGKHTSAGKTVAGSVEVLVEADKVGNAYNVGLKDFTLPGLKGDPKYSQIYGRSKTEMVGGFSGVQKVVSKETLAKIDAELDSQLRDLLSKNLTSQIPANFILYNTSMLYKIESATPATPPVSGAGAGSAVLTKKGTVSALIFDKGALSRAIITKILPSEANSTIKIDNLESLNFSLATAVPLDINQATAVNFSIKGDASFVWVFDENKLKSDLLGLSKPNARTVIATYGNIQEAQIFTSPFWNQTIPSSPAKVTLTNTLKK